MRKGSTKAAPRAETYTHERASFRERVMALAGGGSWREPVEGRSSAQAPIPAVHLIAAALSYGRRGRDDIGPDIACDLATGRMGHAVRVTRGLRIAMGADRSRLVQRNRCWLNVVAQSGYAVAMGQGCLPCPEGMDVDEFTLLTEAARRILLRAADEAVSSAERARFAGRRVA